MMTDTELHFVEIELEKLYPNTKTFLNYSTDWQLLFAVILSAQTTDIKVNKVTAVLFSLYPELEDYKSENYLSIYQIVKEIGLAKGKSENLIKCAQILLSKFKGAVPQNRQDLLTLPGVGIKTSAVFLGEYYNENYFPVDTHVYRVSKRLGLIPQDLKIEKAEEELESLFHSSLIQLHRRFILLGRNICKSRNPACATCTLQKVCHHFKTKRS